MRPSPVCRCITLADLYRFQVVSDPQVSPAGDRIAFVLSRTITDEDHEMSSIWLYDRMLDEVRPLTSGPQDTSPRWAPDGARLAFLSDRPGSGAGAERAGEGRPQVFVIHINGGEALQVTADLQQIGDLQWSPAGERLVVVAAALEPEPSTVFLRKALGSAGASADSSESGMADDVSRRQKSTGLRVYNRVKYRFDGVGYYDDRRRHLFLIDLPVPPEPASADQQADGHIRQLTSGLYDVQAFDWHPDGRQIAFLANRRADADFSSSVDGWQVDAAGGGETLKLFDFPGRLSSLSWSPDGRRLALIGSGSDHSAVENDLWLFDVTAGAIADVTMSFDRPVGGGLASDVRKAAATVKPAWHDGGEIVYFPVLDRGNVSAYAAHLRGLAECELQDLLPGRTGAVSDVQFGGGSLWFLADDPTHPVELWELPVSETPGQSRAPVRRSGFNDEWMAGVALSPYDPLHYIGADGLPMEGWLCLPPEFDPVNKYPLILYIHGGPHAAYGNTFRHDFQARAAQNQIVLFTNPRGSSGYGQKFVEGCVGDWGGLDYQDIMAGVDAAVGRGYVDIDRMAVTGSSYGGYMTNWVITQTDRFKAAVTEACLSNLVSFYGTSDIGPQFMENELHAGVADRPEDLWQRSPLRWIERCITPVLIIHGENDWRCPIEQGEQLFVALRQRGVDTAMVRFPKASHGFSRLGKPSQRLQRLMVIDAWLDRYLG